MKTAFVLMVIFAHEQLMRVIKRSDYFSFTDVKHSSILKGSPYRNNYNYNIPAGVDTTLPTYVEFTSGRRICRKIPP